MEREIEVKLLGIDLAALETKIKDLGGTKIAEEKQLNITVNSTTHPIPEEKGYLRIRTTKDDSGIVNYLTFKEQITDQGVRENVEHTVEFVGVSAMEDILRLMGYDMQQQGYKERTSYRFKTCRIDLDRWDEATYPLPYAEVEANSETELYLALEELGVPRDVVSTKSIAQLIEELKK
ncbi:class IV adenylate cyclase [Peptoniphilus equinus]|uniref:Class IV adenylate cyclase n=1 Tax=Peptoniphilus equinus TaxID=3016343 RepID=A0ABY7QSB4_9FIRM|nr:class IV adenylate cyclase [Peptoniphilus equinus]WBW49674.1 class IV adenylate cyclase [Peptoniphilus equinus]